MAGTRVCAALWGLFRLVLTIFVLLCKRVCIFPLPPDGLCLGHLSIQIDENVTRLLNLYLE